MARTRFPEKKKAIVKSRRTKWPKGVISMGKKKGSIYNFGGHMVAPPDNCPNRFKTADDGGVWVDFALCRPEYCEKYPCPRRMWYNKATAQEKNAEWIRQGVKTFIAFQDYK